MAPLCVAIGYYAYAAVEEAGYAVLDATLARMDADEMAAAAGTGQG